MNYLIDTCVLSEFTHREPHASLVAWLDLMDESFLFISVMTVGEIQRGIMRLAESPRKQALRIWMNRAVNERFQDRILPITAQTMLTWGSLTARLEKNGQPMPLMDSFIAASAIEHNLILVTRNIANFTKCGIEIINPWE
jgi:predicted nucleic acid-binding protein